MCNRQETSSEQLTCGISSQRFATEKRHKLSVDGNHRRRTRGAVKSKHGEIVFALGSARELTVYAKEKIGKSSRASADQLEERRKKNQVLHLYA